MSDDRAPRDELENLGAALGEAQAGLTAAEAARAERQRLRAARLATLAAQRVALAQRLESMTRARADLRRAIDEAEAALAQTRDRLPSSARASASWNVDVERERGLEYIVDEPAPSWAKGGSWLERLIARALEATGKTWK